MSVANEIAGGSGTLCFEKQSTMPLASLRLSCWLGVELVTVSGCSKDVVTSDCVTADSQAGSLPVAAVAVTFSVPISPQETAGLGPSKTTGEDGTTPDPSLPAMTSVSAATCACNSWSCFSRLACSETCTREGFNCSASGGVTGREKTYHHGRRQKRLVFGGLDRGFFPQTLDPVLRGASTGLSGRWEGLE